MVLESLANFFGQVASVSLNQTKLWYLGIEIKIFEFQDQVIQQYNFISKKANIFAEKLFMFKVLKKQIK